MAINPLTSNASPTSLSPTPAGSAGATAQQQSAAPAATTPANINDALLADLNAGSTDGSDPLLADLNAADAANQSLATEFSALTGTSTPGSDPAAQDASFFAGQLSITAPAQRALNAYISSQAAGGQPSVGGVLGSA